MLIEVHKLDLDADTLKQLNDKAISYGLTSEEEQVQILDDFPHVLSAIAEKLDLYVGFVLLKDEKLLLSLSLNLLETLFLGEFEKVLLFFLEELLFLEKKFD